MGLTQAWKLSSTSEKLRRVSIAFSWLFPPLPKSDNSQAICPGKKQMANKMTTAANVLMAWFLLFILLASAARCSSVAKLSLRLKSPKWSRESAILAYTMVMITKGIKYCKRKSAKVYACLWRKLGQFSWHSPGGTDVVTIARGKTIMNAANQMAATQANAFCCLSFGRWGKTIERQRWSAMEVIVNMLRR